MDGLSDVDSSGGAYWGDALSPLKDPKHCRIGFVNINGLGLFTLHNNNLEFHSFATRYDFDVFGMAETNVNWQAVPVHDRLHERSRSWWPLRHVSFSYLRHDQPLQRERHQYGGTAVWTRNSMVHRVASSGQDRYGRWAWTRFRGTNNRCLRVVAAYRPCYSTEPNSVFQQQLRNFPASRSDPRQVFLDDLRVALTAWLAEGDALLVMLDANDDVLQGDIPELFTSLSLVYLHFPDRETVRLHPP